MVRINKVRNHFLGVSKDGKKWRALIQNPKLKTEIYLGHYNTPEEAALAVKKKNTEFGEIVKDDNKSAELWKGKSVKEPECEVVNLSKISDELWKMYRSTMKCEALEKRECDVNTRVGVSKLKGGKWCARIKDPVRGKRIWLGTFDTAENAELAVKMKRVEFNGPEQMSNCASEFDEAMRMGFINEYGQLLGKYSELDENTGFCLPDVAD